jgi:hypothetical protein
MRLRFELGAANLRLGPRQADLRYHVERLRCRLFDVCSDTIVSKAEKLSCRDGAGVAHLAHARAQRLG